MFSIFSSLFFFLKIRRPPRSSLFPYTTLFFFFFNDTATTEISPLSLHDALPISVDALRLCESAHHVADLRHVHRLRGDLHHAAQADDPAEHRHRRSFRGNAARARLGGGHRQIGRAHV